MCPLFFLTLFYIQNIYHKYSEMSKRCLKYLSTTGPCPCQKKHVRTFPFPNMYIQPPFLARSSFLLHLPLPLTPPTLTHSFHFTFGRNYTTVAISVILFCYLPRRIDRIKKCSEAISSVRAGLIGVDTDNVINKEDLDIAKSKNTWTPNAKTNSSKEKTTQKSAQKSSKFVPGMIYVHLSNYSSVPNPIHLSIYPILTRNMR